MITYLYWIVVVLLTLLALIGLTQLGKWKAGVVVASVILLLGVGSYYFHFQQIFVKRLGGVMTIRVTEGHRHLGATWKDDNLWLESFDPATNTCHFNEYSKGSLLEGKVTLKDCNPFDPGTRLGSGS